MWKKLNKGLMALLAGLFLTLPGLPAAQGQETPSDHTWQVIVDLRPLRLVGDRKKPLPGYWQKRDLAFNDRAVPLARALYPKPGKGVEVGISDSLQGHFTDTQGIQTLYLAYKYFAGSEAVNPNPYFARQPDVAYSPKYNDDALILTQGQQILGFLPMDQLPWFHYPIYHDPKDPDQGLAPSNTFIAQKDDDFSPYTYGFARLPKMPSLGAVFAIGGRMGFWGRHHWDDHTGEYIGDVYTENYALNLLRFEGNRLVLLATFPHAHEVHFCGMPQDKGSLRNQVIAYRPDPGDPAKLQFRIQTYAAPCNWHKPAIEVPIKGPLKLVKTEIVTVTPEVLGPLLPFPGGKSVP